MSKLTSNHNKGTQNERTQNQHQKSRSGFNSLMYISQEFAEFMHLNELECGGKVSYSFMTKFFIVYSKLAGLVDGCLIRLSPPMFRLFEYAMQDTGIDSDNFTPFEFPKIFRTCLRFEREAFKPDFDRAKNIIERPGNLDKVEEFITSIRDDLTIYKRTKDEDLLSSLKLKWTLMGLTPLTFDEEMELKVYGGDEDPECCVCMDNDKDAVFRPCSHYCCCMGCANDIIRMKAPCPICRTPIVTVVEYK